MSGPVRITVEGSRALSIAADHWPAPDRPPVILLHGGGQTRHAWGETGRALAARGYEVIAMDLRGHGDSGWAPASTPIATTWPRCRPIWADRPY